MSTADEMNACTMDGSQSRVQLDLHAILSKNSKWHNSGATQVRDMISSSVVGLSGTADLMVKFSVSGNARWRPADILDILK